MYFDISWQILFIVIFLLLLLLNGFFNFEYNCVHIYYKSKWIFKIITNSE